MTEGMYFVYILTNRTDKEMYIGVTNNLERRMQEHRGEMIRGFTQRYHVHKLVYYESYSNPYDAIEREKELKGWRRDRKNKLVETTNPSWKDLSLL